jgi:hypothetical protein
MDGLSTKDLVGVILGIIFLAVIVFARFGSRPRVPKDKFFNCWRCKALTLHNRRTIEAWRNNKTRFFCGACHGEWLRSHPAPASPTPAHLYARHMPRRRSSPVGTLVVFGVVIVASLLARSCA